MSARYIAIEGPIGVGKSDLASALQKKLNAKTYLDSENPFLETFYRDMERNAFQVQLYFLLSRFQQQQALAQGDLFARTILCDYLFQKDRLFASLTLSPAEYALYDKVYSLLKGTLATPDVVIYLQTDVESLLDRISQRNESLALLLPENYLRQIVEAYQNFFFHFTDAPVIVLNTSRGDFIHNEENLHVLIRKIEEAKTGMYYVNPEAA